MVLEADFKDNLGLFTAIEEQMHWMSDADPGSLPNPNTSPTLPGTEKDAHANRRLPTSFDWLRVPKTQFIRLLGLARPFEKCQYIIKTYA